jgi:uridine kinase
MPATIRPIVVGIAGGSAAGKTTIAAALEAALANLRVTCVHQDSYFRKQCPPHTAPFTGTVHDDHNHPDRFHLDRFIADVDATCAAGQWQVVIVEGLLVLQNPELRRRLDLKLFVDCDSDEGLYRRIKRNQRWEQQLDKIAGFYLESVRHRYQEFVEPSRWHADLLLNGSTAPPRGLEVVARWVQHACAAAAG